MDYSWIVPALAAIGVPLVLNWVKTSIEKGDQAQQKTIDNMQADIKALQSVCASKAGSDELQRDSTSVLTAIAAVGAKVEALNNLVLTELGKRPTREEMHALFQTRHVDN